MFDAATLKQLGDKLSPSLLGENVKKNAALPRPTDWWSRKAQTEQVQIVLKDNIHKLDSFIEFTEFELHEEELKHELEQTSLPIKEKNTKTGCFWNILS